MHVKFANFCGLDVSILAYLATCTTLLSPPSFVHFLHKRLPVRSWSLSLQTTENGRKKKGRTWTVGPSIVWAGPGRTTLLKSLFYEQDLVVLKIWSSAQSLHAPLTNSLTRERNGGTLVQGAGRRKR
jgi:hypothetical protein